MARPQLDGGFVVVDDDGQPERALRVEHRARLCEPLERLVVATAVIGYRTSAASTLSVALRASSAAWSARPVAACRTAVAPGRSAPAQSPLSGLPHGIAHDLAPRPRPVPAITTATARDVPALGRVLGDAFRDDPVGRWMAPDPSSRVERLTRFFAFQADAFSVPHGEVLRAGETGAALWMPPGRWQAPALLVLRNLPRMGRVFGRRTALMLRGLSRAEHDHPREQHWYLPFAGVATAQTLWGMWREPQSPR